MTWRRSSARSLSVRISCARDRSFAHQNGCGRKIDKRYDSQDFDGFCILCPFLCKFLHGHVLLPGLQSKDSERVAIVKIEDVCELFTS